MRTAPDSLAAGLGRWRIARVDGGRGDGGVDGRRKLSKPAAGSSFVVIDMVKTEVWGSSEVTCTERIREAG